jgi:integrase
LEGKKPTEAVFSPRTAMQERNAAKRENRKTKIPPSQQERDAQRAANPVKISEFYDKDSYRNAVKHAIMRGNREIRKEAEEKAGRALFEKEFDKIKIPHWTPYQLRNSAATETELENGLDESQALLAHKSANMTRRYSKAQLRIREKLARERVNPFSQEVQEQEGKQ